MALDLVYSKKSAENKKVVNGVNRGASAPRSFFDFVYCCFFKKWIPCLTGSLLSPNITGLSNESASTVGRRSSLEDWAMTGCAPAI